MEMVEAQVLTQLALPILPVGNFLGGSALEVQRSPS